MNHASNHGASFLEHLLANRSRYLKDSLVEDAQGKLRADFGAGAKHYRLRECPDDSCLSKYLKDRLIYDSAVAIQDLLDHPERSDFEYSCELLTLNMAATVCIEGEFNKELVEAAAREAREWRAKGGRKTKRLAPDKQEMAKSIYREYQRQELSEAEARRRTSERLKSEHGIKISHETLRAYPL